MKNSKKRWQELAEDLDAIVPEAMPGNTPEEREWSRIALLSLGEAALNLDSISAALHSHGPRVIVALERIAKAYERMADQFDRRQR